MRKILAKELKIKFIETLSEMEGFQYEDGNPFLIKIEEKEYFIFLKNLSPAYFKNSPDITRVQLPYSDHFSKIFKAAIPFIILGYDIDNDIIVCWDPKKAKERLNAKSNVSLYSRESLQSNINSNEFKVGHLSNGERIILFNRESLIDFFDEIDKLFTETSNAEDFADSKEPVVEYVPEKLFQLVDKQLIHKISPLLLKNKVLEAVEQCSLFYEGKYNSMTFKDWFNLVSKLYQEISNSAKS